MSQSRHEAVPERDALLFLNDHEARTVEAVTGRIVPSDADGAGAVDAGVTTYIDRALAGFATALQPVYRLGLRELDRHCRREVGGLFVELGPDRQDDTVRRFLGPESGAGAAAAKPSGEDDYDFDSSASNPAHVLPRGEDERVDADLLRRFFAVIREHAVEGMFCDPAYGGNRDAVGWRLVGFPGVQWAYTAEQRRDGFDARTIPVRTLGDLRRGLAAVPNGADPQFDDGAR